MHVLCFPLFVFVFVLYSFNLLLFNLPYFVILLIYNFRLNIFISCARNTFKTQTLEVCNHFDHRITFDMYIYTHLNDIYSFINHSPTHTNSKTIHTYSPLSTNNYSPPHNQSYTHNNYTIILFITKTTTTHIILNSTLLSINYIPTHENHTRKHYRKKYFLVTY